VSEAELAAKSKSKSSSNVGGVEVGNGVSGASDIDDEEGSAAANSKKSSSNSNSSSSSSSKKKSNGGNGSEAARLTIWKCGFCPVAYCPSHLPPGLAPAAAAAAAAGTRQKYVVDEDSNQCSHCEHPAPRIQLAALLERSWARLATNYLALPFMRPFLNGATRPKGEVEGGREEGLLDMVGIALRIRGGYYRTAEEYLDDLLTLREQAQTFIQAAKEKQEQQQQEGGKEEAALLPVLEALDTLRGNAKRFLEAIRKEVVPAEALVEEEEEGSTAAAATAAAGGPGIGGSVAWRGELTCKEGGREGGREGGEYCPARTLEEWAEYVRKAPMIHVSSQQPFGVLSEEAEREDMEKGEIAWVIAQMRFEDTWPHRTSLLQRDHLSAALEEQAGLLRRCLEGHALLRKSIAEEKSVVMEFSSRKNRGGREGGEEGGREEGEEEGDGQFVTLGDMHIVKELQIANGNLRARLKSKSGLLSQREGQLMAAKKAFVDVQEQTVRLREELAEARGRVEGLEEEKEREKDKRKEKESEARGAVGGVVGQGTEGNNKREAEKEEDASTKLQKLEQQHGVQQQQQQQQNVAASPMTLPTLLEEQQQGKEMEEDEDEDEEEEDGMLGSASPPATVSAATTAINSSSSGGSGGVEMEEEDASTSS